MLELSFDIHWLTAYLQKSFIMRYGCWYTTVKDDEESMAEVYPQNAESHLEPGS